MGKLFGFLFVLLVIVGAAGAGAWFYGQHVYSQAGPKTADGAARIVMIEKGANAQAIAGKLKAAGAIEDELPFRVVIRAIDMWPWGEDVTLKAGEYAVPSAASIKDIIAQLSTGKSLQYAVIIPEGLTSAMIMKLLAGKEWKSTNGAGPPLKLTGAPPTTPEEGVILPGDYAVVRGDSIESVVRRAIKAQKELLVDLWPKRQPGLPIKTQQDALTLASIVENETSLKEERSLVASLFMNRLRKPMRLESDPTIVYGLTRGVPLGHEILKSERAQKTDWNTYQLDGLPKTPICNPGREAIAAVLNPPQTTYYYFVARGGEGSSAFATTFAEHLKNVAEYREWEKVRNAQRDEAKKAAAAKPAQPAKP